jgi:hypothetical protein
MGTLRYLKIFSRTIRLEKLRFTWKLPDIVQIQAYSIPWSPEVGRGHSIGTIIFTWV